MDQEHREKIKKNSSKLREMIDFDSLAPCLKESNIFPNDMLSDIAIAGPTKVEKNDLLLKYLPKRGPLAYQKFVKVLLDSGHIPAARIMDNLIPDTGVWHGSVTMATDWPSENKRVYPMSRRPRGVALIISNTEFVDEPDKQRCGGEVDERNLKRLFEHLGFLVDLHTNRSREEIWQILRGFRNDERHKSADACVIVVLSHGSSKGFIASDNLLIDNEEILEMMNNEKCPSLHGKPKIFIFSHCRGDDLDMGIPINIGRCQGFSFDSITLPDRLPTYSDMRICYSTCPRFVSLRDETGTWFISTLVKVFSSSAHNTDLDSMLKEVAFLMCKMSGLYNWKQIPENKERGWMRTLYFNPGLYK